jgi:hypothetical protein
MVPPPERRAIDDWKKTAAEIRSRMSRNLTRSFELLNSSEGNLRVTQWLATRSQEALAASRSLLATTVVRSLGDGVADPAVADSQHVQAWQCYHCGGSAYRPLKAVQNTPRTVECLDCGRSSAFALTGDGDPRS